MCRGQPKLYPPESRACLVTERSPPDLETDEEIGVITRRPAQVRAQAAPGRGELGCCVGRGPWGRALPHCHTATQRGCSSRGGHASREKKRTEQPPLPASSGGGAEQNQVCVFPALQAWHIITLTTHFSRKHPCPPTFSREKEKFL